MSVVRFAAVRLSVAAAGAAALALGTVGAAAAAPTPAASTTVTSCKAVYKLVGTWQGKKAKHPGFTSSVRFTNTGAVAVTDWKLTLTFPATTQHVSKLWFVGSYTEAADYAQKGKTVERVAKEQFETPEAQKEMSAEERRLVEGARRSKMHPRPGVPLHRPSGGPPPPLRG